jgi:DNA-binding transcriptional MocR family regulator
VLLEEGELRRAAELCEKAGAWLVMDNTYEHFVYEGRRHLCISGPNIIHLFSFSKVIHIIHITSSTSSLSPRCSLPLQQAQNLLSWPALLEVHSE